MSDITDCKIQRFPSWRFSALADLDYIAELEQLENIQPKPATLNGTFYRSFCLGMVVLSESELSKEGNNYGRTEKFTNPKIVFGLVVDQESLKTANDTMAKAFREKHPKSECPVFKNDFLKVKTPVQSTTL